MPEEEQEPTLEEILEQLKDEDWVVRKKPAFFPSNNNFIYF